MQSMKGCTDVILILSSPSTETVIKNIQSHYSH